MLQININGILFTNETGSGFGFKLSSVKPLPINNFLRFGTGLAKFRLPWVTSCDKGHEQNCDILFVKDLFI